MLLEIDFKANSKQVFKLNLGRLSSDDLFHLSPIIL